MAYIKKITNVITTIVTIIISAIVIFMLVTQAIGIKPFIVLSGSMEPTIHTGSICFVDTHYNFDSVKVNDIVAFQASDDMSVTHRVAAVTNEGLTTKGDANDAYDGASTTKDNFIGKTLFSIPLVGYFAQSLQTSGGKLMCTIFITLLILSIVVPGAFKGFGKLK